MKKRFFFNVFCVLFLVSLVSCDLLNSSLKGYIDEYTNNAAIMRHEFISNTLPTDSSGTPCINRNGTVSLYIRNPKNYDLDFTYAFNNSDVQEYYDTNHAGTIEFIKITSNFYTLTFPESFLSHMDECEVSSSNNIITKDLSGTVSLFERETQRPFGTYDLSFHVDTLPEEIGSIIVMQTDEDYSASTAEYYVCFRLLNSPYNKDFTTLRINSATYQFTYNGTSFNIGESTGTTEAQNLSMTSPGTLYSSLPDGPVFGSSESGYTDFYFKTGDYRTPADRRYTITLTDEAGLSVSATVSSKAEQLTPVHFYVTGIDGELNDIDSYSPRADDATGTATLRIVQDRTTTTSDGTVAVSGTPQIVYTLKNLTTDDVQTKTASSPVSIPLELFQNYRIIDAYATCSNYITSESASIYEIEVLHGPNLYVSNSGNYETGNGTKNNPYRTIQQCISAVMAHEIDHDADGIYINLLSNITPYENENDCQYLINNTDISGINVPITIQGLNSSGNPTMRTIIAGGNMGILFWDSSPVTLKNLTFTGGYLLNENDFLAYGAGVLLMDRSQSLNATITNCIFENNTLENTMTQAEYFCGGAGLAFLTQESESSVTIYGCTFTGNKVTGNSGGSAICILNSQWDSPNGGTVTIKGNTKITGNTAVTSAAGIYSDCDLNLESVTITGNTATAATTNGTGLYVSTHAHLTLSGKTTISGNKNGNENASNMYVASEEPINVTGNLTGSSIGVSMSGEPTSLTEQATVFATYDEENKPAENVFFSDRNNAIELNDADAAIRFVPSPTANGTVIIPEGFYDDIRMILDSQPSTTENFQNLILSFKTSQGAVLSTVNITSVKLYDGTTEIPVSNGLWSYSGSVITYYTSMSQLYFSYKPKYVIEFTYNGHSYSATFFLG